MQLHIVELLTIWYDKKGDTEMKRKKQIYASIAKAHNTTPEDVRKEIQSAMKEAMASTDPQAQRLWASSLNPETM